MGSLVSQQIRFVTANFSGITNSPFQFQSDDAQTKMQLNILNKIFKILFKQLPEKQLRDLNESGCFSKQSITYQLNKDFKWQINIFDKYMFKERFCPQFRRNVGIEIGRLMTRQQFQKKWDSEIRKNLLHLNFTKENQKQIDQNMWICKIYDFLMFKTFVQFSYYQTNQAKSQVVVEDFVTITNRDTDDDYECRLRRKKALNYYQQFLEKYHSKPYLNIRLKTAAIRDLLKTHDIVFLQDCCLELINQLKNDGNINFIEPAAGCEIDCYILVKQKPCFKQLYDFAKFSKNAKQPMNILKFNYAGCRPTVGLVDRYLLISIHLSSNSDKKYKQLEQFMGHMLAIKRQYPELTIIIGGDFNCFILEVIDQDVKDKQKLEKQIEQFRKQFGVASQDIKHITSRKTRTWLQSQCKKADLVDQCNRDFLIVSNPTFRRCRRLRGNTSLDQNLPTKSHPFDHFFISSQIKI